MYLAERHAGVSLVFKFSRIVRGEYARVKRSDFYCISQLGTVAGNCTQRNILFYNAFFPFFFFYIVPLSSLSLTLSLFLLVPRTVLLSFPPLSLSSLLSFFLSLFRVYSHSRSTCAILFAMFLFARANNFHPAVSISRRSQRAQLVSS